MSNNKIFLDSSILVEYVKGAKTDLLDYLLNDADYTLFISQIVVSEFYFHALAAYGNKAPLTLKTSKLIGSVMYLHQPQQFLRIFDFLIDDIKFIDASANLMELYLFITFNYSKTVREKKQSFHIDNIFYSSGSRNICFCPKTNKYGQ